MYGRATFTCDRHVLLATWQGPSADAWCPAEADDDVKRAEAANATSGHRGDGLLLKPGRPNVRQVRFGVTGAKSPDAAREGAHDDRALVLLQPRLE